MRTHNIRLRGEKILCEFYFLPGSMIESSLCVRVMIMYMLVNGGPSYR